MKKMLMMAAVVMMAAIAFAAQCAATTKKGTQCKRQASSAEGSEMKVFALSGYKLNMNVENILQAPIGTTLESMGYKGWKKGEDSLKVPAMNLLEKECGAMCVSELLLDADTSEIRAALGSCVYPTVEKGAFAVTNTIVNMVVRHTGDTAKCLPLRPNAAKRCHEMTYFWKEKTGVNMELVVRAYVNRNGQMGVGCFLHRRNDRLNVDDIIRMP